MTNLLDQIKKTARRKAQLDEAFVSDDGYSTVPDVAFDKTGASTDLSKMGRRKDVDVDADDKDDDVKTRRARKGENPFAKDDDDKDDAKSARRDAEDGDPTPEEIEAAKEKRAIRRASLRKALEDEVKDDEVKSKKARKDADEDEDADDSYKTRKARRDADKDEDDDELSEQQVNRDEDNVASLNSKETVGLNKYKDNAKHVDDMPKKARKGENPFAKNDDDDKDDTKSKKARRDMDNEDDEDAVKAKKALNAIFGADSKLSDAFKKRTSSVFEAAVVGKTNEVIQTIVSELAKEYRNEKERLAEAMVDKVDAYLDKVINEWLAKNKQGVESKLRVQVTESFMDGLKKLFEAHYIEVPTSKEDVFEKIVQENVEISDKLDEEVKSNVALRKQIQEMKKQVLVKEAANGLSANQAEKLELLAEGIDYESDKQFSGKLSDIKEAYFVRKSAKRSTVEDSDPVELNENVSRSKARGADSEVADTVATISSILSRK
jgi:hypothetical protein